MKLYVVKNEYINYLRKYDSRVMKNKDINRDRPYFGVVTELNSKKYLIPLSSPKYLKDYTLLNYNKSALPLDFPNPNKYIIQMLKHTTVPVYYLIEKDRNGNIDLLGKLKFSAMIPVCDSVISLLDIENEEDEKYKNLLNKQINHLRPRERYFIENHAKKIYNQKIKKVQKGYILKSTVNFELLEEVCEKWMERHETVGMV